MTCVRRPWVLTGAPIAELGSGQRLVALGELDIEIRDNGAVGSTACRSIQPAPQHQGTLNPPEPVPVRDLELAAALLPEAPVCALATRQSDTCLRDVSS